MTRLNDFRLNSGFEKSALAAVALFTSLSMGFVAHASDIQYPGNPSAPRLDSPMDDSRMSESRSTAYPATQHTSVFGGPGYFSAQAGVGNAAGLGTQNSLFNLRAGYNVEYSPLVTGRVIGDFNMGTGSDNAYFNDIAVGANVFLPAIQLGAFKPYIGGDAGVGFVRNSAAARGAGLSLAADTGFQWLASQTALDVSLRYEALTANVNGDAPSVLSLNAGIDF